MKPSEDAIKAVLRNCVPRALSASAWTAAAVALCGRIENDNAVAPINAISHILWDEDALDKDDWSLKYSVVALALNASANGSWALIYEVCFGKSRADGQTIKPITGAIAVALLAYVVDYHVVPPRLTPGFEHRLPRRSLWIIYAALALGLFLPRGKRHA